MDQAVKQVKIASWFEVSIPWVCVIGGLMLAGFAASSNLTLGQAQLFQGSSLILLAIVIVTVLVVLTVLALITSPVRPVLRWVWQWVRWGCVAMSVVYVLVAFIKWAWIHS